MLLSNQFAAFEQIWSCWKFKMIFKTQICNIFQKMHTNFLQLPATRTYYNRTWPGLRNVQTYIDTVYFSKIEFKKKIIRFFNLRMSRKGSTFITKYFSSWNNIQATSLIYTQNQYSSLHNNCIYIPFQVNKSLGPRWSVSDLLITFLKSAYEFQRPMSSTYTLYNMVDY